MKRLLLQLVALSALFVAAGCGPSSEDSEPVGASHEALVVATGVDYAWARPSPSGLYAEGYTFAARYLSYATDGKNISKSEADALWTAGVDVVANWEYDAQAALNGYSQGVADAQTAQSQAVAAGMPPTRPIFFSVDFDASQAQEAAINDYFDGVASVLGVGRTGAYGGYYVVKRLFDAGKIAWGWQTYAWSGGQWDARAQLRQVQNDITAGGDSDCCDEDQAVAADYGQWHAPPPYPTVVHREAVDLNGDGRSDVCARASTGIVCEVSNQGGPATEVKGPAWSDANGWNKPEYHTTIQLADVNGDGRGDLCARDSQGIVCELSTGDGFGAEIRGPAWSDANGWADPQYYGTIQFADVNGDGKADVCARASAGVVCDLSDGNGFPTEIAGPAWSTANGWGAPLYDQTIRFVDVNGDGKADVCGRSSKGIACELSDGKGFPTEIAGPAWSDANGWSKPQYMETLRWADVNGDGKVDVCGRAAVGIVCELSDGNGFPTEVTGPAWSDASGWAALQYYTTIQMADVNGDGKADVCGRASSGIVCALSQGTSFSAGFAGPAWTSANGWDDPIYDSTIGFADVNGDGKDDVCGRASDGVFCALSTGSGFADATLGPAWSNGSGWGVAQYYSTIRYAGVVPKKAPPPPTGGSDGGADSGDRDGGTGPGVAASGGCSVGHGRGASSAAWLALAVGLALVKRRRSRT